MYSFNMSADVYICKQSQLLIFRDFSVDIVSYTLGRIYQTPVVLAVLIGILSLACSNVALGPTVNIDRTAEAEVSQKPTSEGTMHSTIPNPPDVTQRACKLTGGDTVQSGWIGKDTGNNYCNSCFCTNGVLGCTKIGCPATFTPGTSDSSYKRGYEHYRKGDYDLAIDELTDAILLNPDSAAAYWVRGLSYYRKDLYQQAVKDYDIAIELDPKEPKLYRNRGMVYHKLNLEFRAVRDFSEAIKIDATYGAAYSDRAHSYVTLGRYSDAVVDIDSAIRLNPRNASLYKNRADIYEQLGLSSQANSDNAKACSLEDQYC